MSDWSSLNVILLIRDSPPCRRHFFTCSNCDSQGPAWWHLASLRCRASGTERCYSSWCIRPHFLLSSTCLCRWCPGPQSMLLWYLIDRRTSKGSQGILCLAPAQWSRLLPKLLVFKVSWVDMVTKNTAAEPDWLVTSGSDHWVQQCHSLNDLSSPSLGPALQHVFPFLFWSIWKAEFQNVSHTHPSKHLPMSQCFPANPSGHWQTKSEKYKACWHVPPLKHRGSLQPVKYKQGNP